VLPLVLALLALVALPGFASAAGEEIPEYKIPGTASFKVQDTTKPKHKVGPTKPSTDPRDEGSAADEPGEGESRAGETEPEETAEKEGSRFGGAPAGEGGGNGGAGGGSNSAHRNGGQTTVGVGAAEAVAKGGGNVTPVAHNSATPTVHKAESSGGGSSPVVPILIAMVVLAAFSIGVVLFRERNRSGALDGDPRSAAGQ
jgi:hypothetical protein